MKKGQEVKVPERFITNHLPKEPMEFTTSEWKQIVEKTAREKLTEWQKGRFIRITY